MTHPYAKAFSAALLGLAMLAGPAHADEMLFGYISPVAAQPNEQITMKAIEAGAKALGWTTRTLDANLSADRQVAHVDTLLTLGAKAIASWSLDPNAVAGAYSRANGQGVPVIGVNSVGEGVTGTVWWEVNVCRDGSPHSVLAKWIAKRKPGAKVVVMGGPPAPSIIANVACFTAAAKAAGLVVIDQVDNTKDSSANAATLAADELTRFPDVQAFWAYNDSSALGISGALLASGKATYTTENQDGIMIFGINGDTDAIAAVREGRVTGTWDPDSYAAGLAVVLAAKAAVAKPGEKQKDLIVRSKLFTAENIDSYVTGDKRGYTLDTVPLVD